MKGNKLYREQNIHWEISNLMDAVTEIKKKWGPTVLRMTLQLGSFKPLWTDFFFFF